uniref:Uncharacterized protein n=1 Tax=Setaria italica TaxID=4555 RepID=K3YFR1_SETIT
MGHGGQGKGAAAPSSTALALPGAEQTAESSFEFAGLTFLAKRLT